MKAEDHKEKIMEAINNGFTVDVCVGLRTIRLTAKSFRNGRDPLPIVGGDLQIATGRAMTPIKYTKVKAWK